MGNENQQLSLCVSPPTGGLASTDIYDSDNGVESVVHAMHVAKN